MTMQMEDNSRFSPSDWVLVQRTEFDKERKARLAYSGMSIREKPKPEPEPWQPPLGVRRRPENTALAGISKGWRSRDEVPESGPQALAARSPGSPQQAHEPRPALLPLSPKSSSGAAPSSRSHRSAAAAGRSPAAPLEMPPSSLGSPPLPRVPSAPSVAAPRAPALPRQQSVPSLPSSPQSRAGTHYGKPLGATFTGCRRTGSFSLG